MKLVILTPPTASVLTTDDAKEHARIFGAQDDEYIDGLIAAGIEKWQKDTKFVLAETEYTLTSASLFSEFELPLRPVIEVVSINDLVEDTDYAVSIDLETGIGTIKFLSTVPSPVTVAFKVGFPDPDDGDQHPAPALAKHAVKTLVAHWFNAREAYSEGSEMKNVPTTYQSIVASFRLA